VLESWSIGFFVIPFLHCSITPRLSQHYDPIPTPLQGRLDRIGQSRPHSFTNNQAIHHASIVCRSVSSAESAPVSQARRFAIDANSDKSFALHLLDHIAEFTLLILQEWREQDDFWSQRDRRESDRRFAAASADELVDPSLDRAVGPRPKRARADSQRSRSRSRSWNGGSLPRSAARSRSRAKAFDEIDVRLFHLIQKLPGVGGEAFHIAALPLGIKGVEGERGFPDPLKPVITTSFSLGISTWRFLRLCWRAPLILIVCAASDDKCRTC